MSEPRKPSLTEQVMAVAASLMMGWYMMPPQERYWAKLRMLNLLHKVTGRLALREGFRGMADELRGRDRQRYGTAYLLSLARDGLAQALEDMRP